MKYKNRGTQSFKVLMVTATTLLMVFALSTAAFAQQQPPPPQNPPSNMSQAQSMPTQPPPGYSENNRDNRDYSNEDQPQQDPRYAQDQRYPDQRQARGPQQTVPSTLTLAPGTLVTV